LKGYSCFEAEYRWVLVCCLPVVTLTAKNIHKKQFVRDLCRRPKKNNLSALQGAEQIQFNHRGRFGSE